MQVPFSFVKILFKQTKVSLCDIIKAMTAIHLLAITGAVAEAYFGLPPIFRQKAYEYLWEADRCNSTNGLLTYNAQMFEKNYYLRTFFPREQMPVF